MLIFNFSQSLLLRSNHSLISHTILSQSSKLQSVKPSISLNAQFISCSAYSQQPTSHRFNFTFPKLCLVSRLPLPGRTRGYCLRNFRAVNFCDSPRNNKEKRSASYFSLQRPLYPCCLSSRIVSSDYQILLCYML